MLLTTKNNNPITLDELNEVFGSGVYEALNNMAEYQVIDITQPKSPQLPFKGNSDDFAKYAKDLKDYESEYIYYEEQQKIINNFNNEVESAFIEYVKEQAGLFTIPEQYRSKVWYHAWEDGHSYGLAEIYSKLVSLVEIFN